MFYLLVKPNFFSGKVANPGVCNRFAAIFTIAILNCITTSNCCQLAGGNADSVKNGAANRQCSCNSADFNVLPGCSQCNTNFHIATKDFVEDRVINATFTVADPAGYLDKPLGLNVQIVTLRSLATEKECCTDDAFVVLRVFALHRRMPVAASQVTGFPGWLQKVAQQTTSRALTRGEISEVLSAKQTFPGFSGTVANCLTSDIGLQEAVSRRTLSSLARHLVYPQLSEIDSQSRWPPYILRLQADSYSDLVTLSKINTARRSSHVVKLLINGKRLYNGAKFPRSLDFHVTLPHSFIGSTFSRDVSQLLGQKEVSAERLRKIFERTFIPTSSNVASRGSTRCEGSCVSSQQIWAPTLPTTMSRSGTSESTTRSELDSRTPQSVSRASGLAAKHSSTASASSKKGSRKSGASKEETVIGSIVSVVVVILAVPITLGLKCYYRRRRQFAAQVATDLPPSGGAQPAKILKFDGDQENAMLENEVYASAPGLQTKANQ